MYKQHKTLHNTTKKGKKKLKTWCYSNKSDPLQQQISIWFPQEVRQVTILWKAKRNWNTSKTNKNCFAAFQLKTFRGESSFFKNTPTGSSSKDNKAEPSLHYRSKQTEASRWPGSGWPCCSIAFEVNLSTSIDDSWPNQFFSLRTSSIKLCNLPKLPENTQISKQIHKLQKRNQKIRENASRRLNSLAIRLPSASRHWRTSPLRTATILIKPYSRKWSKKM